jgi:antitoxin component YwqK of YwqJK toxin-antitoxin module
MQSSSSIRFQLLVIILIIKGLFFQACQVSTENTTPKNDPYNGIRRAYRQDGTLLAEVTYKDSIRDGLARNFYKNGKIQLEMTYVKGIRHGDAYTYYEDGDLYQVTPYVHGKRNGIQRKYYKGNVLMAEIPFENNEQVEGIKEYSKDGKLISREARVIFNLIDKTDIENKFDLVIQLSDGSPHAKFSRIEKDNDGKILAVIPIQTDKGKAVESYFLNPGTSKKETIYILAERKTRLGNNQIFFASFNLAVENESIN